MDNIFFSTEVKLLDLINLIEIKYKQNPDKKDSLTFLSGFCNEYSECILLLKSSKNIYGFLDEEQSNDLIILINDFVSRSTNLLNLLK